MEDKPEWLRIAVSHHKATIKEVQVAVLIVTIKVEEQLLTATTKECLLVTRNKVHITTKTTTLHLSAAFSNQLHSSKPKLQNAQ